LIATAIWSFHEPAVISATLSPFSAGLKAAHFSDDISPHYAAAATITPPDRLMFRFAFIAISLA
jgi:hypothetical protein